MTHSTPRTPASTGLLTALLVLRLVLLFLGLAAATGVIAASGTPFANEWGTLSSLVYVVPADLITLAVVAWLLRRQGSSIGALLGRFKPLDLLWGLLIAVALTLALYIGTYAGNLAVYGGAPPQGDWNPAYRVPLWLGVWSLVVAPVTIALAEEVLYRGFLQPRWAERIGFAPALLLVALFFGLQHVPFVLADPGAIPAKVLATFLGGLLLGLLYRRIGRLWPLVLGHWLADVVGLGLIPFLSSLGS